MFYHRKELAQPVNVGTPDARFGDDNALTTNINGSARNASTKLEVCGCSANGSLPPPR